MYIAMNRFRVAKGREQEFIDIWKDRDSQLNQVPGFKEFHLLQGASDETATLFSSHVVWASAEDFGNWTRSEAFRMAHASAGGSRDIYLGPPQFEGFEVVL
jgi:heme-degrading monooxygenase HmoA